MLRTLINPKTEEYQAFKKLVLSKDYVWRWYGEATNGLPVPEGFAPVIVYYTDLLFRPDAAHDLKGYPLPTNMFPVSRSIHT